MLEHIPATVRPDRQTESGTDGRISPIAAQVSHLSTRSRKTDREMHAIVQEEPLHREPCGWSRQPKPRVGATWLLLLPRQRTLGCNALGFSFYRQRKRQIAGISTRLFNKHVILSPTPPPDGDYDTVIRPTYQSVGWRHC